MSAITVSAVEYLNARPLVHGLDSRSDLFSLQFDVPSKCASLLQDKSVDLGLIPSIEYLRHESDYRIVPDIAVASKGASCIGGALYRSSSDVSQIDCRRREFPHVRGAPPGALCEVV